MICPFHHLTFVFSESVTFLHTRLLGVNVHEMETSPHPLPHCTRRSVIGDGFTQCIVHLVNIRFLLKCGLFGCLTQSVV